jgi:hypothetical protein
MGESSTEDNDASKQAQNAIYRKVDLSTVVSLLELSTSSTSDMTAAQRSIQAVTKIELIGAGALTGDLLSKDGLILTNSDLPCLISTYRCEDRDSYHLSVRELGRFVSLVDTEPEADELIRSLHGERYRLTIEVDAGYQLEAWLQHVSPEHLVSSFAYLVRCLFGIAASYRPKASTHIHPCDAPR